MIRWVTCREFVEFLDDYLAGRLQGAPLVEFNNHLSKCPPCVLYMQSYQESIRLGKAALATAEAPVPEVIPEALIAAILAVREKAGG